MSDLIIKEVRGQAVTIRGNDIDTDRIIPARFLKCVVFEGLGEHAFADDRIQLKAKGELHPFDNSVNKNASILFVNKNFGCGSSREHAPQSLYRWGIRAIVGESYSEIFYGNNVSLGVPCAVVSEGDIEKLMTANEANPGTEVIFDIEGQTISCADLTVPATIAPGPREQFLAGSWDVTAELLASGKDIDSTAEQLPYFKHWK